MALPALSEPARRVLDRMDKDRRYEASELHALMPGASAEAFREVMHELWINRQVERAGHAGWRRHRSSSGHDGSQTQGTASHANAKPVKVVKPEDLFDHDTFQDFFR